MLPAAVGRSMIDEKRKHLHAYLLFLRLPPAAAVMCGSCDLPRIHSPPRLFIFFRPVLLNLLSTIKTTTVTSKSRKREQAATMWASQQSPSNQGDKGTWHHQQDDDSAVKELGEGGDKERVLDDDGSREHHGRDDDDQEIEAESRDARPSDSRAKDSSLVTAFRDFFLAAFSDNYTYQDVRRRRPKHQTTEDRKVF